MARGIGIVLVVVGHTLRGLVNSSILPREAWPGEVDRFIYAFHMPLFFLLSGLFAPGLMRKAPGVFLWDRVSGVLYPYVLWSVLQTLVQSLMGGMTNNRADPTSLLGIAYQPIMQFWFLHALFLITVLVRLLCGARVPVTPLLALGVLLHFLPSISITGAWPALNAVKTNLVYYVLGYFLASRSTWIVAAPWREIVGAVLGLSIVGAFSLGTLTVGSSLLRFVVALAGSYGAIALGGVLARSGRFHAVATLGRRSLEIFVAHTLASAGFRIVLQRGLGVSDPMVHVLGGTAVGLVGPLVLVVVAERFRFPYLFSLRSRRTGPALSGAAA